MDFTLDRATVEDDSEDDQNQDRILHSSDVVGQSTSVSPVHISKRHQIKIKAKQILHVNLSGKDTSAPANGVTLSKSPDASTMPGRLDDSPANEGLHGLRDFVHQPVQTTKARVERATNREAAKTVATAEVSHAHDVELVMAQDRMNAANTEEERSSAYQDLERIKMARQDMFVRWTMDRHVLKLRQLESQPIPSRSRGEFTRRDNAGHVKTDWTAYGQHLAHRLSEKYGGQYIGSFADPPAASKETISASIEKLIVASTPWQEILMHVRRVYRWDNPRETMMYLVIFMFLWVTNYVASAILFAIVVQVLRRRLHPSTVDGVRKDLARTEDSVLTALTIGELIGKHGEHRWIEPLIEEMGPWLMIQLADLSNLLEVILNFYEWRQPRQTAYTLSYFSVACLAFCFTPSWLLVKAITLGTGFMFFGLFPIGSRYPDYRLLASPAKWLFWNIPDHAEWAIARLQIEGARQERYGAQHEEPIGSNLKDDTVTGQKISNTIHGSYKCISKNHSGRLLVTSRGIQFQEAVGAKHHWELSYDEMHLVQKVDRTVKISSGQGIAVTDQHDNEYTITDVVDRDEAFTQIVGYSKVKWQVVG